MKYRDWSGAEQDGIGFKFKCNDADTSEQFVSANEGIILCAEKQLPDGKMLSTTIQEYLDKHPSALRTVEGMTKFIEYMKPLALNVEGKTDIYTSGYDFLADSISGGPTKNDIKVGKVYVGPKKADTLQAYRVAAGVEFEGAPGTTSSQVAGKDGAYILKDKDGVRMIQAAVFNESYSITKKPKSPTIENVNE